MWNYVPNTQAFMTKSEQILNPFITASKNGPVTRNITAIIWQTVVNKDQKRWE